MKERIKWIAVGFGLMVGIQVLASLMLIGLGLMLERSPGIILGPYWAFVIFGLTLAAFFFGGFIIGRVEETPRVADAVIAAIATLALSAIVYLILPESSRTQFTGSGWLDEAFGATASAWISAFLIVPALVASALGAYAGYLMTTPILPLEQSADEIMIGQAITMIGYPSGVDRLIALLPEKEICRLEKRYGESEVAMIGHLAQRNLIKPLTSQGHIMDLRSNRIVYDATTAEGESGAPVFGPSGRVIGIHFGYFRQDRLSNYAVPISKGLGLLSQAGWRPAE